ncbi:MAG: nitroreductase family protein, partial [Aeromonas sp.]
MTGLELLLGRHSCGRLAEPAPSGTALENIVQAGLRAPDHGGLTPWQFIVFTGDARERLGALLADAACAR